MPHLSDWPRSAAGYETICELGKSAHGSTWKAACTTNGRVVSIKRLNFDAQANLSFELFDAIRKEVSLSMTFSHKCIQTVHAAFVHDAELWVVVDYMDKVCSSLRSRVITTVFRFTLRRVRLQTLSNSSGAPARPLTSGLFSTWHLSC